MTFKTCNKRKESGIMGQSNILSAFAGPQPTPQACSSSSGHQKGPLLERFDPNFVGPLPEQQYQEDKIDHQLGRKYNMQVYRRTPIGFGTGGALGEGRKCGIKREGKFIPLAEAFPEEFPRK